MVVLYLDEFLDKLYQEDMERNSAPAAVKGNKIYFYWRNISTVVKIKAQLYLFFQNNSIKIFCKLTTARQPTF